MRRRLAINAVCMVMLITTCAALFAQKIKREYRISTANVHPAAKEFVNETLTSSRVKWYAEEHEDGKKIEAKGSNGQRAFSIEFDNDGEILDIEKEIRFAEFSPDLQQKIRTALSKDLVRYQLISVQEVSQGMKSELKKAILEPGYAGNLNKTYELVVRGRTSKGMGFFEYLFDTSGKLIAYVELKK